MGDTKIASIISVLNEEGENHIKVEVSPDKIVGYLDDEQAFEVEEGPAEGRIGFSLFGTSAVFDDIVVYDEGGLAVEPAEKLAAAWGELKRLK